MEHASVAPRKLPVYSQVLTAKTGPFPLKEYEQLGGMAALELSNKRCCLVASETFFSGNRFQSLRRDLMGHGYTIESSFKIPTEHLRTIYDADSADNTSNNVDASKEHESKVTQEIDRLFERAMLRGASDIHIYKLPKGSHIRFRVNGIMVDELRDLSSKYVLELCQVMYNCLADPDSKDVAFSELTQQGCSIKREMPNGSHLKLRYNSSTLYPNGLKVVLRLLPEGKDETAQTFEKLGLTPFHSSLIKLGARKPVGAMIIAGTTGSGKSTTLKNVILWMYAQCRGQKEFYTVEDPPEFALPLINQIPVPRSANESDIAKKFRDCMRAVMRMDPDVAMVGEVRDSETAILLQQMIESGHQVLTTLHTGSALRIVPRLEHLGIDRNTLASPEFLSLLVYQKLAPVLCDECKQPALTSLAKQYLKQLELIGSVDNVFTRNHKGCRKCEHGIKGRTLCAEIVMPDDQMLELFRDGKDLEAYRYWRTTRDSDNDDSWLGRSALDHGIYKMHQGLIAPDDLEDAFGPVLLQEIMTRGHLSTRDVLLMTS